MIENLFRNDLSDFEPYQVEEKNCRVVLDANESFLNVPKELQDELGEVVKNAAFNRYPDADSKELCNLYLQYIDEFYKNGLNTLDADELKNKALELDLRAENIIAGNGSDELIQMIVNAFTSEGDKILVPSPNFSMYKIYARVSGAITIETNLKDDFKLDVLETIRVANREQVKIVFLSNPNNPTGAVIPEKDLINIIENTKSIIVVDEAYGEFYGKTIVDKINKYENLIVLRTCSKLGLAAIRLGFLITNSLLMNEIRKVKPPYNVNSITQQIGAFMLNNREVIRSNIDKIVAERTYLFNELSNINGIKAYQTGANFIFVELENAYEISQKLLEQGISVKSYKEGKLTNFLRITVGSRPENFCFLSYLKNILR